MGVDQCNYEDWLAARELKYSATGVERSVKPAATIRRARAVLDIIGVTKVADVTDLDRIGIPNFVAVRPHDAEGGISYYNGKGTTRDQAHAGAMMEAIERHAAERYDGPIIAASHANLRRQGACVDPLDIHVPMVRDYGENIRLEWAQGFDLIARRPIYVPLNCLLAPYRPYVGELLFYSSTNGLASGNTRVDALCHALCEVIERDTVALAMAETLVRPAVIETLSEIGFDQCPTSASPGKPLISLRGLPRHAAALVRKMQRAGLGIELRNLTSELGIPTIDCVVTEQEGPSGVAVAYRGAGTHPDARIALTRALTEAAQSRLTGIHGGREDLTDFAPPTARQLSAPGQPTISFGDIPSHEHASVNEDLAFIIDRMRAAGFDQAVAFDLTRAEVGIPVVRVVVPRAESWTIFIEQSGRAALGPRALRRIT
ncbi:YcaO-like family protein [Bradyrhizobium genosp. L]|uniref:YcaO-like family protein n=1 Tax=Bradyrhizobium genosp. L TaxID=83637 RepID=UPI0018A25DCE|nr:YcaO-like family protein [Bradyrhizobium genosp. L]QPF83191.1 YcaO-like family protein [Bradyrhizobium genosp. L]